MAASLHRIPSRPRSRAVSPRCRCNTFGVLWSPYRSSIGQGPSAQMPLLVIPAQALQQEYRVTNPACSVGIGGEGGASAEVPFWCGKLGLVEGPSPQAEGHLSELTRS